MIHHSCGLMKYKKKLMMLTKTWKMPQNVSIHLNVLMLLVAKIRNPPPSMYAPKDFAAHSWLFPLVLYTAPKVQSVKPT